MLTALDGGPPYADRSLLTRSQEHALRRCESLTHAQLKKHLEPVADPRLRSV